MQMQKGMLGTLNWSVNTYEKNSEISLTLIAEKGTISLGGEFINKINYQQSAVPFLVQPAYNASNDYGFYRGSMSNHSEVYKNLVEALQNSNHPFANVFDGLKTVEAIEKIYKAVAVNHLNK